MIWRAYSPCPITEWCHHGSVLTRKTGITCDMDQIKAVVLIRNQLITTIIDTGATMNFITPNQLRHISDKTMYVPVNIDVFLADVKNITEAVELMVTLGNVTAECKLLAMRKSAEDIVLGLDFLRKFNTTLTCVGLKINCSPLKTSRSNCHKKVSVTCEKSHGFSTTEPPISSRCLSSPENRCNTE